MPQGQNAAMVSSGQTSHSRLQSSPPPPPHTPPSPNMHSPRTTPGGTPPRNRIKCVDMEAPTCSPLPSIFYLSCKPSARPKQLKVKVRSPPPGIPCASMWCRVEGARYQVPRTVFARFWCRRLAHVGRPGARSPRIRFRPRESNTHPPPKKQCTLTCLRVNRFLTLLVRRPVSAFRQSGSQGCP